MAMAGLMLLVTSVTNGPFNFGFKVAWFVLVVILNICALAMHVRGYQYLGTKVGSAPLNLSARVVSILIFLFGAAMAASSVPTNNVALGHLINMLVGITLLLFIAVACVFAVVLIRQYKRLGIIAVLSTGFLLFPLFFWSPWPTIILLMPSTYLLFREAKG
jgi:hypothetical protein